MDEVKDDYKKDNESSIENKDLELLELLKNLENEIKTE
jgi:hypothetical protein